jgi:hypothetical protein
LGELLSRAHARLSVCRSQPCSRDNLRGCHGAVDDYRLIDSESDSHGVAGCCRLEARSRQSYVSQAGTIHGLAPQRSQRAGRHGRTPPPDSKSRYYNFKSTDELAVVSLVPYWASFTLESYIPVIRFCMVMSARREEGTVYCSMGNEDWQDIVVRNRDCVDRR